MERTNRPNAEDRVWASFKASIVEARTKPRTFDTKAMERLKERAIVVTPDAELDRTAYLSDLYFQQRKTK